MSAPKHPEDRDAGVVIEPVPYRAGGADAADGASGAGDANAGARVAAPAPQPGAQPAPALFARAAHALFAKQKRGALLLAAALLLPVAFLLWLMLRAPAPEAAPAATRAPAPSAVPTPVRQPPASPEQAAELARLQGEVQTLLSALESHAPLWAAQAWQQARADFAAGEAQLQAVQTPAALAHLESAQRTLRSLQTRTPEVRDAALAAGARALAALELEAARESLALARAISPEAKAVRALAQRVQNFPEMKVLLETAEAFAKAGELAAATEHFERAHKLDPAHPGTREKIARLQARTRAENFTAHLRKGHAALTAGELARARRAFTAALALRPGDADAARALAEVAREEQALAFEALLKNAARAAAREDWQRALALYEKAAAQDASAQTLRENLRRTRARAELDAKLARLAADRTLLFAPHSPAAARALLASARKIMPRGPRLAAQLRVVGAHLELAQRTLPVELVSDGKTSISVQRHGELGAFKSKRIALRPGVWVVTGTRRGYRDVRHTLTLQPERGAAGEVMRLALRCTETIE